MTYRNAEGYPDPTAGEALANVYREQRAALWAQAIQTKHNDRPKSSRPPCSVQRARQKANKDRYSALAMAVRYIADLEEARKRRLLQPAHPCVGVVSRF